MIRCRTARPGGRRYGRTASTQRPSGVAMMDGGSRHCRPAATTRRWNTHAARGEHQGSLLQAGDRRGRAAERLEEVISWGNPEPLEVPVIRQVPQMPRRGGGAESLEPDRRRTEACAVSQRSDARFSGRPGPRRRADPRAEPGQGQDHPPEEEPAPASHATRSASGRAELERRRTSTGIRSIVRCRIALPAHPLTALSVNPLIRKLCRRR